MKLPLILLSILFTCLVGTMAHAADEGKITYDKAHFRGWLIDFSKEAEQKGISGQTIYDFLKNTEFLPTVIKLDRKQPDVKKTFNEYLESTITSGRISRAQDLYKENKALLHKIGEHYNVQPRFIVALWGIESDFGRNMGNFSVINSLATLAYEGRRAEFFRGELLDALRVLDREHMAFGELKGSWAGAMGQTQFMPSSFLKLAVDHDRDGKDDIWGTKADVFASIANYLSSYGWDDDSNWGREVSLPNDFDSNLLGKEVEKTIKQWQTLGVHTADGKKLPGKHGLKASIIKPEKDKRRAYIVYPNYRTVMQWNRSLYFATAVGLLADEIGKVE